MKTTTHLTNVPADAILTAWHTSEDICSYQMGGKELFAMSGRARELDPQRWHSAPHLVASLDTMDSEEFVDYAAWLKSELFY